MSPALSRGFRKLARSVLQVVASGGATAITELIADAIGKGLGPEARVAWTFAWYCFFVFAQNTLETKGSIPTLLPSPGLVTKTAGGIVTQTVGTATEAVATTAATVEAVVDEGGDVVGQVTDTTGDVIGDVTGTVEDAVGDVTGAVGGIVSGVVGGTVGTDRQGQQERRVSGIADRRQHDEGMDH